METYTFDLQRIFFGDISPLFLVEIIFRTSVLFVYTLLMLRLIGTRGVGQLTLFELALIIALGSAVGDPMLYPDVPLVHGMMVITMVIVFQRVLVRLTNRYEKIENFIEGKPIRVVVDGRLDLEGMEETQLSNGEVFMELRIEGCENLGEVRRAYQEIDGNISVFYFKADDGERYGLPLIPPPSRADRPIYKAEEAAPETAHYTCTHCGATQMFTEGQALPHCPHCEKDRWWKARKVDRKQTSDKKDAREPRKSSTPL